MAAIAAVVLAALISAVALATFLPANADSLRVHLNTLSSAIAEGLTLARGDDEAKLTRSFYDTELGLLRKDAEETAARVASARALPELQPKFAETASLATIVAARLRDLALPGAPAESVIAAQATLQSVQTRLKQIEEELPR